LSGHCDQLVRARTQLVNRIQGLALRGSAITVPRRITARNPWILRLTQYFIIGFELASPLLLVRGRIGRTFLVTAAAFHLITYASITIIFLPHVMCLLEFTPLERVDPRAWVSARRTTATFSSP
jgi:hypothetical protein